VLRTCLKVSRMTTIPHADKIKGPGFRLLLFLALIAVGLAGNYFKFSILNADFIFGSIFSMLALQLLGFRSGIVAAAIISGYTYLAWNHPYAILTMTAEVAVVGWLTSHRKINLVAADSLYWFAIGIPMGYLCFHFVSHLPESNSMFLMTKQAINGVANCMVARLIFTGYALRSKAPLISLREIVSNLLVFFALCTGLIMLTVGSRTDFSETDHRIHTEMTRESRHVTNGIEDWLEEREAPIVNLAGMAATISPAQMQIRLEQARTSDKNFLRIALVDKEATAIAYSPLVDELGRSTIGRSFADRLYIPEIKQKLQPVLSQVMESKFGRPDPVAIMLAPVILGGEYGGYVAGILNLDRIRNTLEINSTGRDVQYTLQDRNGNVIITSRKDQKAMTPFSRGKGVLNHVDEGISQWIPDLPPNTSTIELWGKSFYVVESAVGKLAEWKLILEQPVAPFQQMLYDRYTVRFSMLFVVVLALLVLAEFLSRRMVSTTEQLGLITVDLPAKLASQHPIAWPESAMLETNHLIRNFRDMADSLLAKFTENRQINESLEQLVKERTHELKKSQEKLSTAMEIARLGHWDYDIASDLFTFNDHFYKLFRTTAEQVGGYTMSSAEYARRFVHPDDIRAVGEEIRKAADTTDPHYTRQLEHRMLYADGTVGYIIVRFLIVQDAHGRTVKTYGVNQDITDRRQTEEALKERDKEYRTLFEDSIDGVYSVLRDGTITDANPSFCELFEYTREEMIGKDIRELYLDPADRLKFQKEIEKKGFVKDYEVKFRKRDGTEVDCLLSSSVHYGKDGNISGYRGILRDLTVRKALHRQLQQAQKMEAVGTLAGGVAHDFNNILQVVLGYSELLLLEEQVPKRFRDDLAKINLAARNGADLVQQLLTFSRKTETKPLHLNLNGRIEQLQKMLSRTISRMIEMDLVLTDDLWSINADPTQVDQVLMNLAVNARDAMPEGGKLVIETKNVTLGEDYSRVHLGVKPGSYVLLSVSDTGQGMDKETVQHIFEPFFTTKGPGEGTGLGLATVYGIVKQHDGYITCYSEPGSGTTFRLYFPALGTDDQPIETASRDLPRGGSETILLVDDEEFIRDLGSRILTNAGYKVFTASNGKEALEVYHKQADEIALVILDLIMPEMAGKQCLEGLLELDPAIKIVIASGYSANGPTKEALSAGAKGFVNKPYDIRQVLEVVRTVLDGE
jgi:two-component system, cell cycle sensor histidine kinase and response regulator CckA